MAVNALRSATTVLEAVEVIARSQPVGLAELTRQLGRDKSSVQRVLKTLAESGWIQTVADGTPRWELTTRVLAVGSYARARTGLGQLLLPLMISLRDQTGETVLCAVPDGGRVVITDVVESTNLLRVVPTVGMEVPTRTSALGQALLAAMDRSARARLAGEDLSEADHAELDHVARRGWSLNADAVVEGSTSLGSALLSASGVPVVAISVAAVSTRMPPDVQTRTGKLLATTVSAVQLP